MAAINRPTEATYVVHDKVTVETTDNEDHTFCGIMFPVKCKDNLPLDHVIINSVAVRGGLGPLTVWVSNEEGHGDQRQFRMHPRFWTKIYQRTHVPSHYTFQTLDFSSSPIVMKPGQVKAIYIHSTLPGDEAIVYDNRHHRRTYEDALVTILTGRAHVSTQPFGTTPIWGWGNPWRDQREFVGRIEYGAVYKLWNPASAQIFGGKFQALTRTLFMCQRRWDSPVSMLPDDCIFYILNMCRWDWANDTPAEMKEHKRRRLALAARISEAFEAAAAAEAATQQSQATHETATADSPSGGLTRCCHRRCSQTDEDEDNVDNEDNEEDEEADPDYEEFHDAEEEVDDEDLAEDSTEEVMEVEEEGEEEEEEEDDDHGDDDDDDDDDDWEDGYNANSQVFRYDDDSDNEVEQEQMLSRQAWIRRQFARIHVLQALANLDDNGVVEMNL